jgi:alkylhydroperoxidase family enzyme
MDLDGDAHLRPFFETWLRVFIFESRLDPQLRELSILRVLWRCERRFEWGNHYRLARGAGVDRETIASMKTGDPARDLDGPMALVVRAADDVVDIGHVTANTLERPLSVVQSPMNSGWPRLPKLSRSPARSR